MIDISNQIQAIGQAKYGEEVREAIQSALIAMNEQAAAAQEWATGEGTDVPGGGDIPGTENNAKAYAEAAEAAIASIPEDYSDMMQAVKTTFAYENPESIGHVSTVICGYSANNSLNSLPERTPFLPRPFIRNAVIHSVKCKLNTAGTLSFGYVKESAIIIGELFDTTDLTVAYTHTFETTGEHTFVFPVPFVVPAGYVFAIGDNTDTATFKFGSSGPTKTFIVCRSSEGKYAENTTSSLGFDINIVLQNYSKESATYVHQKTYAGFDEKNTDNFMLASYPVIPSMSISNTFVSSVKLSAGYTGQLTFGYAMKDKIIIGSEKNWSHFTPLYISNIAATGENTIVFPVPLYIPEYAAFAIGCQNSDAARIKYGDGSAEQDCICPHSTTLLYRVLSKSCGVDVVTLTSSPKSIIAGKKVSIYGDSISTFQGYIPSGNAKYYPISGNDVTRVSDTWWKKAQKALEFDLLVNNSWSGRAVSSIRDGTSAHSTDAGYKQANVDALSVDSILPDIIIVKLGINDFDSEAPLGTYDGRTAVSDDPSTFLGAYGIMLQRIMTTYPNAKVYCCTLAQVEVNGSTGFPETNDIGATITEWNEALVKVIKAFGAEVLDHNACGLTYFNLEYYTSDRDNLHPNAAGHSLMANKTIETIDPAVRIRYPGYVPESESIT